MKQSGSMANIALRPATQSDFPAIRALIWRVGNNPLALDWRRFVVAVDAQGRLAGCGQVKPHRGGLRELASISVRPDLQGQGIGSAVVRHLLELHTPPLYLTCVESRVPFYRRFGFRVLAPPEMPPYYQMLVRLFSVYRFLFLRPVQLCVMILR